jgi:hypothetical protein
MLLIFPINNFSIFISTLNPPISIQKPVFRQKYIFKMNRRYLLLQFQNYFYLWNIFSRQNQAVNIFKIFRKLSDEKVLNIQKNMFLYLLFRKTSELKII